MGEHTNEQTYVRTYSHTYVRDRPYIPSITLLCEGIIIHLNLGLYLYAKYQDPSKNGSSDILFTRLFLYKMPVSEKGE